MSPLSFPPSSSLPSPSPFLPLLLPPSFFTHALSSLLPPPLLLSSLLLPSSFLPLLRQKERHMSQSRAFSQMRRIYADVKMERQKAPAFCLLFPGLIYMFRHALIICILLLPSSPPPSLLLPPLLLPHKNNGMPVGRASISFPLLTEMETEREEKSFMA